MNRNPKIRNMVIAGLLCAVGIVIPMFSPIKIVLEPASFTLASHVAVFIAMFLSPVTALSVSLVSAVGFLLGGFPIVVVARAASHVIFATIGAYILKKHPTILESTMKAAVFALAISVIHGIGEVLIVCPFYFGNSMSGAYYTQGFAYSVIGLVGVGTVIHSMIDFVIALFIWKPLVKVVKPQRLSTTQGS